MQILERIRRQAQLVDDLAKELAAETSYRGIERLIQLTLQALLDLGLMVAAALGGKTPKAYSEIGAILNQLNVINRQQAETLRSMAGLRNILVHLYAAIDREKILRFAETLPQDAPRLAHTILEKTPLEKIDPPKPPETLEKLRHILQGRVKAALLFGGRAKGYMLKADYDIAVYFGRDYSLLELGALAIDIAQALKVDEDRIDLICLDTAPPQLTLEALQGTPIIVDSQETILELKLRALTSLLDIEEAKRIHIRQHASQPRKHP